MFKAYTKTLCCSRPRCCVDFAIIDEQANEEDLFISLNNEFGNIKISKGDSRLLLNELFSVFNSLSSNECACPVMEVDFESQTIRIRDDYSGSVFMTLEEFTILARNFLPHV